MTRRGATMAVAATLLVLLTAIAALLPVPYVALNPGPTFNTLGETPDGQPLIEITGRQTYPTDGHLNLTTVGVTGANDRMSLFEALRGWVESDVAVVPREAVYPEGQSTREIEQRNAEQMELSQEHAIAAALLELGVKPVTRTVLVTQVATDAPAAGKLHAGDVIVAVNGTEVTDPDQVVQAVRRLEPGDEVRLTVRRGGAQQEITVPTRPSPEDPAVAQIGIGVEAGYQWPFHVTIQLDDVGGPSAGLMFALGIYDKLTPGDLTGGRFVAGTGTIDDQGAVGSIGGVQMKIIRASRAGAVAFLTPASNCAEATRDAPSGLRIVPVKTLDDALAAVEAVSMGATGSLPTCTS